MRLPPGAGVGASAITPGFLVQSQGSLIQKMPNSPVHTLRTPVTAPACKPPTPLPQGQGSVKGFVLDPFLVHVEVRVAAVPKAFTRSRVRAPGRQAASSGGLKGCDIHLPCRG